MGVSTSLYMLLGAAAGVLAAAPLCVLLHAIARGRRLPPFGVFVAAAVVPFVALLLATFRLRFAQPEGVMPFGVASALAYLSVVTVAGLASWRAQN